MILGTAGHIDHGKTTLVRALTGVDTDRLPEERRRGITIDLGFAPLQLDGIGQVGVVDVPGHEAFVRTMVAGATGIDLALVVIAADAGVMPQTREHLAILTLLGVRRGVVAISKCDLVDDDWLSLVDDDVRAAIDQSSLVGATLVHVSATTGSGLDTLREALRAAALRVPTRSAEDLVRIPIDRAFTVRGTGTVVTGTVWSGTLARDASVRVFPAGLTARVRGLHVHGQPVDHVRAGERAAIALAGVDVAAVGRGAVLVQGDAWRPSHVLRADVRLTVEVGAVLDARSRVRFLLGTSEVGARLVVPGGALSSGETHAARVVLDEPLIVRAGDRFVIRAPSPVATLGGGVVTDPYAPARARAWSGGASPSDALLVRMMREAGAEGVRVSDLPVRLGILPLEVGSVVTRTPGWRVGARLLDATEHERLSQLARDVLRGFHGEHGLEPGAPAQWLRSRLNAPDDVSIALVADLLGGGEVEMDHGSVRLRGFVPAPSESQERQATAVGEAIDAAGTEPPTVAELAEVLGAPLSELTELVRWLARCGTVVQVESDRYYSRLAVSGLVERLTEALGSSADRTPSELRDMLGLSRKYLIPFLEYCDREGITMRTELGRRLSAPRGGGGVP